MEAALKSKWKKYEVIFKIAAPFNKKRLKGRTAISYTLCTKYDCVVMK